MKAMEKIRKEYDEKENEEITKMNDVSKIEAEQ